MVVRFSEKLPRLLLVMAAILVLGASQKVSAQSSAKEDANVLIDQASLVKLDRPAAEIVVANPSIADVSVQSGKLLVVTGKPTARPISSSWMLTARWSPTAS